MPKNQIPIYHFKIYPIHIEHPVNSNCKIKKIPGEVPYSTLIGVGFSKLIHLAINSTSSVEAKLPPRRKPFNKITQAPLQT